MIWYNLPKFVGFANKLYIKFCQKQPSVVFTKKIKKSSVSTDDVFEDKEASDDDQWVEVWGRQGILFPVVDLKSGIGIDLQIWD